MGEGTGGGERNGGHKQVTASSQSLVVVQRRRRRPAAIGGCDATSLSLSCGSRVEDDKEQPPPSASHTPPTSTSHTYDTLPSSQPQLGTNEKLGSSLSFRLMVA